MFLTSPVLHQDGSEELSIEAGLRKLGDIQPELSEELTSELRLEEDRETPTNLHSLVILRRKITRDLAGEKSGNQRRCWRREMTLMVVERGSGSK